MKRLIIVLLLMATPVFAQEAKEKKEDKPKELPAEFVVPTATALKLSDAAATAARLSEARKDLELQKAFIEKLEAEAKKQGDAAQAALSEVLKKVGVENKDLDKYDVERNPETGALKAKRKT